MKEPVARGQRIINEVVFEADPELGARVRFVRPMRRPLLVDEHTAAPSGEDVAPAQPIQDVVDVPASSSVWEALEPDDSTI